MQYWEWIVVGVIVAVAAAWGVRAASRAIRRGAVCADCSDAGSCPLVKNPELIEDLLAIGACKGHEKGSEGENDAFSHCQHRPD